jgi:Lrp/AsnC family transcriptional regulator for asnA, asnC and gidA
MRSRIDEMDLRILDLLQADGRMPFVKIAEQLGVSDTTVRTRVDRLVRRFGVKFVVDVDPNDLGLVYVYLAVGVQGPALARVVERMTALPSVIFLARTVGTHDLMAEAICRDHEDLMRLLDEIRAIPGVVRMDTLSVLRVEKEDWRFVGLAARRE